MKLVEFPLERGGDVLVQVDSAPQAPTTRGLGSQQVRERAQQTFEQAVDAVRPAAEALINPKLRRLGQRRALLICGFRSWGGVLFCGRRLVGVR
jgi:hypothetical protein